MKKTETDKADWNPPPVTAHKCDLLISLSLISLFSQTPIMMSDSTENHKVGWILNS